MNRYRVGVLAALVLGGGAARAQVIPADKTGCGLPDCSLGLGIKLKQAEKLAEAEKVFAALVAANPNDVEALEQDATVLGWLGRYDESIAAWTKALALKPDVAAYAIGRARIRYWKGDHALARTEVLGVLKRLPESFDALVLAGDICAAQGEVEAARGYYQRAQKQDPSVAELQMKLDRLATASGAPKTWRGDVGGALDSYNTTRGTEGMFFAQLGAQANGWLNVSAGVEQMRWFGATDTRLNAVAAFRLPGDVSASVRGAVTPSAHFLASWELWGTLDWQALKALNVALWVRHNEYATSSVTTFIPNFRVDVGQVFVSAQVAATLSTGSDPTFSAAGKVGYQFTDAVSAYLGGAHGNEPMPPLPAADTTSGFAGVLWDLNATFGVRLDYAFEHRVDQYDKHTIGTGVTLRF